MSKDYMKTITHVYLVSTIYFEVIKRQNENGPNGWFDQPTAIVWEPLF